jgi:hypothetical protein
MSERVKCFIEYLEIEGAPGLRAECSACGHCVEARGKGPRSVAYAMATMRDECPEGTSDVHFYVADVEEGGESPMPKAAVRPWWEK